MKLAGSHRKQILTLLDVYAGFVSGRVHVETVDVTDEAAVDASFASMLAVTGRVDCVFANAGIVSKASAFPDMTSKMYHELLNVSLHGAFYTLRAASRHMRARASSGDRGGSIVICGSLSIFRGLKGMEHYAAAKGALAAMVKSLALEHGEFGVRVNMIAPGFIPTGMTASGPETDKLVRQMAAVTPLGRVGTPEDIEGPQHIWLPTLPGSTLAMCLSSMAGVLCPDFLAK